MAIGRGSFSEVQPFRSLQFDIKKIWIRRNSQKALDFIPLIIKVFL